MGGRTMYGIGKPLKTKNNNSNQYTWKYGYKRSVIKQNPKINFQAIFPLRTWPTLYVEIGCARSYPFSQSPSQIWCLNFIVVSLFLNWVVLQCSNEVVIIMMSWIAKHTGQSAQSHKQYFSSDHTSPITSNPPEPSTSESDQAVTRIKQRPLTVTMTNFVSFWSETPNLGLKFVQPLLT